MDRIQFVLKLGSHRQKSISSFLTGHRGRKSFGAGNPVEQGDNMRNQFGIVHSMQPDRDGPRAENAETVALVRRPTDGSLKLLVANCLVKIGHQGGGDEAADWQRR